MLRDATCSAEDSAKLPWKARLWMVSMVPMWSSPRSLSKQGMKPGMPVVGMYHMRHWQAGFAGADGHGRVREVGKAHRIVGELGAVGIEIGIGTTLAEACRVQQQHWHVGTRDGAAQQSPGAAGQAIPEPICTVSPSLRTASG
jgi:hypothetical protein